MQNDQTDDEKELDLKRIAKIVGLIIVALWLISLFTLGVWISKGNEIGDSFGAVNALFSGLALAGIILTILMQRDELKLQRKELELTRREMELTRDEFISQNYTLKLQQFENTYFQMLSLFHENINSVASNTKSHSYVGKRLFNVFLQNIDRDIETAFRNRFNSIENRKIDEEFYKFYEDEIDKITIDDFANYFKVVKSIYQDDLSIYFTTLLNILKLIDKAEINDKLYYISVISSQFTKSEKLTIFYYTISTNESSDFRSLVEKYNLLDGIKESMVINKNIFAEYKPDVNMKYLLL